MGSTQNRQACTAVASIILARWQNRSGQLADVLPVCPSTAIYQVARAQFQATYSFVSESWVGQVGSHVCTALTQACLLPGSLSQSMPPCWLQREKGLAARSTLMLCLRASLAKLVGLGICTAAATRPIRFEYGILALLSTLLTRRVCCHAGPGLVDMAEACSANTQCQAFATNGNLKVRTKSASPHGRQLMPKQTQVWPVRFAKRHRTHNFSCSGKPCVGIPASFRNYLGCLSKRQSL